MNTGAFGENFPYSNFHDLNTDWIIKIAKDFLDQYTHIQEVITNGEESLQNLTTEGLEQLQTKADALEALLQEWYNTHSEDIANQLTDALKDLNEWYTTHENYLDQTLTTNEQALNTYANQKLSDVLNSIPDDYTAMGNTVKRIDERYYKDAITLDGLLMENDLDISAIELTEGNYNSAFEWITSSNPPIYSNKYAIHVPTGASIIGHTNAGYQIYIMEFNPATNTRIRNISSSTTAVMDNCNINYLYVMSVQSSTGLPTTGFDFHIRYNGNDYICTKDETNIIAEILSTGYAIRNDPLVLGFFDPEGIWKQESSNRHYSIRKMYRFPKGTQIEITSNFENGFFYIKGFTKTGNTWERVLNTGGNATSMVYTTTRDDLYYNIDLYNSSGWSNPPTGEYQMKVSIPGYTLSQNASDIMHYSYNPNTSELTMQTNKTKYTFKRITNTNINIDSWRFYEGKVFINGDFREIWNNSDAEGPILIDNEADFISGYHGDEHLTDIQIYIDTELLDLTTQSEGYCHSITLYQTSDVFRANTETLAFVRFKRVRVKGNNYNVQQRWVSRTNCTITRGALCTLQAPKTYMIGWDTDRLIPMRNQNTGGSLSKNTRIATFYLEDNTSLSLIPEVGCDNEYFTPSIANFADQNRLKIYFDMYNGLSMGYGDVIESKFSVILNELK